MRFSDQVAIVTGGAKGIGLAAAERLASEGAAVVIVDRDAEAGADAVRGIVDHGASALFIEADVSSRDHIDRAVDEVLAAYGKVDVLVNNAGVTNHSHFLEVTEAEFDEIFAINFKSQFGFAQTVARHMISAGTHGSIVNLTSITAALGVPTQAAYGSSKGAINSLTRVMATALAEHGIRVNAVGPGTILTPMAREALAHDTDYRDRLLSRIPMQRFGDPAEIAGVIAFLASADSSYMTGQVLYPDGGRSAMNLTVPIREESLEM